MGHLRPGEHEATLNGVRIHYTITGEGPVLLVHSGGPGMDTRTYENWAGLDRHFTLVIPHPRGSGLSGPAPAPNAYRLTDYAADVEALRRHLRLGPIALLGHSHGGMVALRYAIDYPDKLSHLVAANTAANLGDHQGEIAAAVEARSAEPWFAAGKAALELEVGGAYDAVQITRAWHEMMPFYFCRWDERAEAYRARTVHYLVSPEPLLCFNRDEAGAMDMRPELGRIRARTLILTGRHDFITSVAAAQEMAARIPGSQLAVMAQSGHQTFVEEPERMAALVRAFIAG